MLGVVLLARQVVDIQAPLIMALLAVGILGVVVQAAKDIPVVLAVIMLAVLGIQAHQVVIIRQEVATIQPVPRAAVVIIPAVVARLGAVTAAQAVVAIIVARPVVMAVRTPLTAQVAGIAHQDVGPHRRLVGVVVGIQAAAQKEVVGVVQVGAGPLRAVVHRLVGAAPPHRKLSI